MQTPLLAQASAWACVSFQPPQVFRKPALQPARAAVWSLTNGKIAQGKATIINID